MVSLPRISLVLMLTTAVISAQPHGNINTDLTVNVGMHYPNKSSVSFGINGDIYFSVKITMSESCASYNCTSSCPEDPVWYYDWNKIWGKSRCGYYHHHHLDSDRFVFRRCSDPSCAAYVAGQSLIQIAGYSYDNGLNPYSDDPSLLKIFSTLISPDVRYSLAISMSAEGSTSYLLMSDSEEIIETQVVNHKTTCPDNYFEGYVLGLYFGGTCPAPVKVDVLYES